MASRTTSASLLRISKGTRKQHAAWAEGAHLVYKTGLSIPDLRLVAAADRWRLASGFRLQATRLLRHTPSMPRDAISRGYYAMYHGMRAVALVDQKGDDHEGHSVLPTKVPRDFPNHSLWANTLKNARERRNAADYDPYPKTLRSWSPDAEQIVADATEFLVVSRRYLVSKGCTRLV